MREAADHVDDLVAAYVLGALEPEEVEAVELHLVECAACRALVEEERRVAGLLPYLAEPRPVPLRARRRLLARVVEESEPIPLRRRLVPTPLARAGWASASVAAILAAVFGWNSLHMQQQIDRKDKELSAVRQKQDTIAEWVSSRSGFVTKLQNTGAAPGAHGTVTLDPTSNAAFLFIDGLPKPPVGQAYVVWLVKGDEHVNVGVLPVDDQGRALLRITTDRALVSFDGIMVTEESGALAQSPSSIRLMTAQVGH
ncbi:MAG: anti-sigma factor [Thermomicrobiaceae bacterium]|nr:anti-sigma factor [Thermomicrobiaceae bacterium]